MKEINSSRELVKKTLEFKSPNRVPRQLWLLPWASEHYPEEVKRIQTDFPDDVVTAPTTHKRPPKGVGDPHTLGIFIDEWGCIFENKQKGIFGQVKKPLLKEWEDVDKIRVPEELLTVSIDEVNTFCRNTDKFVLAGCCPRPFERLQFIRKTENLFMDLIEQPEELFLLIDKIHRFYKEETELWCRTDVDGLCFMDDWGSQNSLLISPQLWRRIFKPLYKDYIDIAHKHDKYIFFHSDGYITEIIPEMIDLGLDAINCQIFCMGVEQLGVKFRGGITFWGEIDRQHILPYGTSEGVINAVKKVKELLYQDGGVIAQCEFGAGAKPENVYLVFKTWDDLKR